MSRTVDAPGVDPALVLGPLAMMPSDPTIRVERRQAVRVTLTPEGPGIVRVKWGESPGVIRLDAEGDGAQWLTARAARLIGAEDDPSSFAPNDPVVRRLWARFSGDRIGSTGTVWHDLAWTITQQRVHRRDAALQWKQLVRTFGEPCPTAEELRTPPDPDRLARTAPWSLRALGIDERRATTLIAAARVARRLHGLADAPLADAQRILQTIPGVGPWTVSCLSAFTWGDPDTVITGDSGIPLLIASTLTGARRADDAAMLKLLEPYRPHRYRVLRLALAARTRPASQRAGNLM